MLPPTFEMDDYRSCLQNNDIYCKMHAILKSTANDSDAWRFIKSSEGNNRMIDRNLLHRALCIPKQKAYDDLSRKEYLETVVNQRIEKFNLTSSINILDCTDGTISVTFYDYLALVMVISYICLVLYASFQDLRRRNKKQGVGAFLQFFSIIYNWKKKTRPINNEDYEKLKSIQGIRLYNIFIIIWVHTKLSYSLVFIDNVPDFEQILSHPVHFYSSVTDTFLVLTFFMISSWLLTTQICHIFETHGEFSFKNVCLIILNRYFRIAVTVAALVMFYSMSWLNIAGGPMNFEMVYKHQLTCKNKWMGSIFFWNNFHFVIDMCNGISWYLSADFQLYILNTFILYVIFKYNLNMKKVLAALLITTSVFHGAMIYIYNMDTIYRMVARNLEARNFFQSTAFMVSYTSTYSIAASSCIGVILGSIYFNLSKRSITINKTLTCAWVCLFFGLPVMAVWLSSYESRGIRAAVLGSIVRPMYTLGIGVGILGMSQNIGGIIKRICDWKPAVVLSNFTYCIYICHLSICFLFIANRPVKVDLWSLTRDYLVNVLVSVIVGIIIALIVEEPGFTFQKMILPQVKKYKKKKNEKAK